MEFRIGPARVRFAPRGFHSGPRTPRRKSLPYGKDFSTNNPVYQWQKADAPYRMDYPHLFALNDGKVYGFGRDADQQFVFDPAQESRGRLLNRRTMRLFTRAGSASGSSAKCDVRSNNWVRTT